MEERYYETYYQHETEHWWFRWRFALIHEVIGRIEGIPKRPRMLDAGCGTGQMLKMLQRQGSAVGLDLSHEAIIFAASRDARNLVLGSVTNPPFAEGTFDVALALDVIEHVDDDCGILEGLRSIVRPGGALIVTVPAFEFLWSDHDRINHHRRRYRAGELRARLEGAGFEIDRVTYCNTALFPVVALVRRAQAIKRRFRPKSDAELSSDLHRYPQLLNGLLYQLMLVETRLLRRFDMPVGVSILAVARRPIEPEPPHGEAKASNIVLVDAEANVAMGVQ
jgi:SAM-dependent methyltransferase